MRPTASPTNIPTAVPTYCGTDFTYTGDYQEYVVPADIVSLTVTLYGAAGGSVNDAVGGLGAMIKAEIPVTPGETLRVYVGAMGTGPSNSVEMWNGGGTTFGAYSMKGGGGDGTDIRRSPYSITD